METTQEQLDLVKSCIVQNAYYNQKIHRLGEVASLVCNKASLFLNSISNEKTLRKYIDKTVSEVLEKSTVETSIENIQEQQEIFAEKIAEEEFTPAPVVEPEPEPQPISEAEPEAEPISEAEPEPEPAPASEYDFIKELELLEDVEPAEEPVEITVLEDVYIEESQSLIPTTPQENAYSDIEDPIVDVKTKRISKELTERIIDVVLAAQKEEPEKQYSKIFYSKYVKKMKQSEIAREMGISEEELSSRYLKLVRIVKKEIG